MRRVGNHTSGLPLHFQFFYEDEPFCRPSFEETILRFGNLVSVHTCTIIANFYCNGRLLVLFSIENLAMLAI